VAKATYVMEVDWDGDGSFENAAPTPSFSRPSSKYKKDGTVVSNGTPTYEAGKFEHGVHVEEATTNLVQNGGFETNLTYWSAQNGSGDNGVVSRVAMGPFNNNWCLRYTITSHPSWGYFMNNFWTYLSAPYFDVTKQYTMSFWAKKISGASSFFLSIKKGDSTNVVLTDTYKTLTSEWTKFSITFTPLLAGNMPVVFFGTTMNQASDILISNLQIEQKAYATSFMFIHSWIRSFIFLSSIEAFPLLCISNVFHFKSSSSKCIGVYCNLS